ncbi:hypothetical protein AAE02nite_38000 [Adhaeribacter aerolatus]|uniref:Uncharacterized protein n=1 Tax=Adhaeribacter aerolatus TaxID=670289 RepID=A0A512B2E7_9BACT|nr:hypothetical protein [Adhaeribacter aerolatus]GEO06136.1 hypothetical protein AAE02nite_38000 [Adhaeribacter aerolatus]
MSIARRIKRNKNKPKNNNNLYKQLNLRKKMIFSLITPNECRNCDGPRKELSFEQLPEIEKKPLIDSNILERIDYFLYCPESKEYNALLK